MAAKIRYLTRWAAPAALLLGTAVAAKAELRSMANTWPGYQAEQAWATARLKASSLRHEWVSIPAPDGPVRGFVTYPAGNGPAGVVIVAHEVFGLTDSTRNTADEIAALGYITIAPDMVTGLGPHGGNVESFASSQQTADLLTQLPDAEVNGRLNAIASWGLTRPRSNGRLGFVGLSWGGGAGFRYADWRGHDPRLKLVCVFYDVGPPAITQGPNRNDPQRGTMPVDAIDVPIDGFYASEDARVMASLDATSAAMAAAHKAFDPIVYPGAGHAFMRLGDDPANASRADHAAVLASLDRLRGLLHEKLAR